MSNPNTTTDQPQYILNKAHNTTYKTIDVTPMVETSAGVAAPLGYQAPMPAKVYGLKSDGAGTDQAATLTTMYDGDTGASTESLAGVMLRQSSASGSLEAGTAANPWNVTAAEYPFGATPLLGYSGNRANATATATLTGAASKTTYITGFEVTAAGATAAAVVNVTVTGLYGSSTLTYVFTFPAGAAVAATPLIVQFPRAIPSNSTNTNIVVTVPAGGAGNAYTAVTAHGYLL